MLDEHLTHELHKRSRAFYTVITVGIVVIACWVWFLGRDMVAQGKILECVGLIIFMAVVFGLFGYLIAPFALSNNGGTITGKLLNVILFGTLTFLFAMGFSYLFPLYGFMPDFVDNWYVLWPTFLATQGLKLYLVSRQYALSHLALIDKQSQFRNLQTRIYPHFLFNALNNIAALLDVNRERAETALLDLADVMRASISTPDSLITLDQEVEMSLKYAAVEQLRWEHMLVEADIPDDCKNIPVPMLIVQPLIENAVYHGVSRRHDGGTIRIQAHMDGDWIYIKVSNPVADAHGGNHKGNGFALVSVEKRLNFMYEESIFETRKEGDHYIATIAFNVNTYSRIIDDESPEVFSGITQSMVKK